MKFLRAAVLIPAFTMVSITHAAVIVWKDVGTAFTTGANWVGGVAPANSTATDIASFGTVATFQPNLSTGNRSINGLAFTATSVVTFSGTSTLTIGGSGINNSSASGLKTVSLALVLGASQTFTNNGSLTVSGNINGGANNLILTGTGGSGLISGILSGTGTLTMSGTGTWALSGANTFTGKTSINSGTLSVNSLANTSTSSALGAPTTVANGTIAIGSTTTGATLAYTGTGSTTNRVIDLAGTTGGATLDASGSGALVFTSAMTATGAGSKTLTLTGSSTAANTIQGAIVNNSGANITSLAKSGTGTWVLSGANTFTGATTINAGTLQISADNNLGQAPGAATASQLTLGGGTLEATAGFTLNSNRGIALTSATTSNLTADTGQGLNYGGIIAGAGNINYGTAATGTGTITLSGANTYTGSTTITAGAVNIQNGDALGNASNTANTTVASGASLQMAGNITTTNAGTLVLNGTGTGSGALQNLSGNNTWNSNVTIASNATIFSSTAGNLLTLGNTAGTSLFTMGANTVTFDGPGDTWINSNVGVSGDTGGLVKNGTGKLTLYGYNTFYTGATTVNAGSMDLLVGPFNTGIYGINGALTIGTGPSNPALAGTVNVNIATNSYANQLSPTSAVTINSDGALNVGSSTGLGSLTLNGGQVNITSGINISPTGSITANANSAHQTSLISGGQITLAAPTVFTVARDATITSDLTVNSVVAGTSLVKQGAGVLTFAGSTANTYTGTTAVNDGTLALGKTAGVNALGSGAVTVGDGVGAASSANLVLLANNQTSTAAAITLNSDGRLALNNFSTSINTISGTGLIDLATSGYLIVGANNGSSTFGGSITGTGTLEKTGSGTLTLQSNLILAGELRLSGGTLALNGFNLATATLHLTGNSTIDFSGGNSNLTATNFIIDAGVTLTIANWANAADYFFATNWTGAVYNATGAIPMNQVVFNGFSAANTKWQGYDNQVTPVPEPSTYGALLLGAMTMLFGLRQIARKPRELTPSAPSLTASASQTSESDS
jgi:fibronectin-binding autotransporter adhesin